MGDLYFDDIEDQEAYPDTGILSDVRALINAGQREGPMLDYKIDVSEKDNWAETAAAFANSFGGLIIFGVGGHGDQPRPMTGFDPQGVETKTRLASTLLSRIQPRPDFQIRVVTHDKDPTKEVAILRVPEGSHPPYMHSRDGHHRIYLRVAAQKTEADYLQLSALFEKRRKPESEAVSFLAELTGPASELRVTEPPSSNLLSPHWYRFVLAADDDRAARRLTLEVEHQFKQCLEDVYRAPHTYQLTRAPAATYFRRDAGTGEERRFALSAKGTLGFVTYACPKTSAGPFFIPFDFCRNLIYFLILAGAFYEKARYYGDNLLEVTVAIPERAQLYIGVPTRYASQLGSGLFEPPLEFIQTDRAIIHTRVALHPVTSERLQGYVEEIMNDLARMAGRVLSPSFRSSIQPLVHDALNRPGST